MALGRIRQIRKIALDRLRVVAANLALIIPNAVAAVVIVLTVIVSLHYRQRPRSD